jgi:ribose transport system substrate-binding protein
VAAITFAFVAAACGQGSSTSSTSSTSNPGAASKAKALADKEKAPVKFPDLGAPFDASKAKGKSVYWISNLGSNSFTTLLYNPFKEAMDLVGVQVHFFDGKGQASEESRGVEEAIAAHADMIYIQNIAIAQIKNAVDDAHKAGITVVEWANNDAGKGPTPGGGVAETTYCYSCAGQYMAHAAIASTDGYVNAVIITSSDVPVAQLQTDALLGEFKSICPDTCHAKIQDVLIADWTTRLPVVARTAVTDPKVNWVMPLYDPETTFVDPAIIQAGAANRVKVCSYNATTGAVEQLKQPGNPLYCDIGSSLSWSGYANADMVFRVLAGVPPLKDEKIPLRTFDRTNVANVDFSKPEATWYGSVDFKVEYKKLWRLSS